MDRFISQTANNVQACLEPFIESVEEKYTWPFPTEKATEFLHIDFSTETNSFSQSIKLKLILAEKLAKFSDFEEGYPYGQFFVEDWGKVRRNKNLANVLRPFFRLKGSDQNQAQSIRTLTGVSSWSKYLSILCPWAAIYDSRVAYAINAINLVSGNTRYFFPMPDGQSPRLNIIDVETLFILNRLRGNRGFVPDADFNHRQLAHRLKKKYQICEHDTYPNYLKLIDQTAKRLRLAPDEHFKIEMLLFALAPNEIMKSVIDYLASDNNMISWKR